MAQSLRVLLFNADESYTPELRGILMQQSCVKIVAELDEPSLLPQALEQFPVDLLFVHLDPDVDFVLEIVRQVLESNPTLPAFALSQHTDGDVVLRAMRAGFREFLVKPLSDEELRRATAKIEVRGGATKEPGKIIATMGSAGGLGATTIATNLAVELSNLIGEPGRVALVDLDFRFGQIGTMLDLSPTFTVADLCGTLESVDPAMINKAAINHESGVRVLARPNNFAQADAITAAHCLSVLNALAEMCDYVVVDGPTRYDVGGQTILDSADLNLMIIQLVVPSVRNADRIYRELGQQGFNLSRMQLVCNRVEANSGTLDVAQVQKTLNRQVFASIPDDTRTVSAAVNMGLPLCAQWSKTRVRQAMAGLAAKIHDPKGAAASDESGRGSLIGRLLGGKKPANAPREESLLNGAAPA